MAAPEAAFGGTPGGRQPRAAPEAAFGGTPGGRQPRAAPEAAFGGTRAFKISSYAHANHRRPMKRAIHINGKVVEVEESKIKAGDLLRLAGRNPDEYELQLRKVDRGPVVKTYRGDEIVDLDSECGGGAAGPGGPDGGAGSGHTATNSGDGSGHTAPSGGPGGGNGDATVQGAPQGQPGGKTHTTTNDGRHSCYFTTRYTGPINPA